MPAFTTPIATLTDRQTHRGPPSRPPSIIDRVPFRAPRHKGVPSDPSHPGLPNGLSFSAPPSKKAPQFTFAVDVEDGDAAEEQLEAIRLGLADLDVAGPKPLLLVAFTHEDIVGIPTPEQLDGLYLRCTRLLIAKESPDWREILHQLFAIEYGHAEAPE